MTEPTSNEQPFSPCTGDCAYDAAAGYCKGCFRTLSEVANWVNLSPAQRDRIWQRIEQRRAEARKSA